MAATTSSMEIGGVTTNVVVGEHGLVDELASYGPITLTVNDYGGKEKVGDLPFTPQTRESTTPTTVRKGEIYLYGSKSLVIFYRTEANQWGGYTYIGRMENPEVLDPYVGSGSVDVTLNLRK